MAMTTERPKMTGTMSMTGTMRAMVITENGGPEVLVPAELPMPVRLGSEALIRIVAAGVHPIDADARAGRSGSCGSPDMPAVLGHDFSGVVIESPYAAHPLKP